MISGPGNLGSLLTQPRHVFAAALPTPQHATAVTSVHRFLSRQSVPWSSLSLTTIGPLQFALADYIKHGTQPPSLSTRPTYATWYSASYPTLAALVGGAPGVHGTALIAGPVRTQMVAAESIIAKELVKSEWFQHVLDLLMTGLNAHLLSLQSLPILIRRTLWVLRWGGFRAFDLCHAKNTVTVQQPQQELVVHLVHHKTTSRGGQAILRRIPLKVFPSGLFPVSGPVPLPTYDQLRDGTLPHWPQWDHHCLRRCRILEMAKSLTLPALATWFAHASRSSTLVYLRALPTPVQDNWAGIWEPAPPRTLPSPLEVLGVDNNNV